MSKTEGGNRPKLKEGQSGSPAVRQSGSPAVRQSGSPAVRQSGVKPGNQIGLTAPFGLVTISMSSEA